MVLVNNPHLEKLGEDILYHFGLTTSDNLPQLFGDVKFVCCGGSASRMRQLAETLQQQLDCGGNDSRCHNFSSNPDRYSIYKVGPVLCINHGIGMASMSVMLHETLKLLHHAHCSDITMIRVGSSGGIGIEPGTVVVCEEALNGLLEPYYVQYVLGKVIKCVGHLDKQVAQNLINEGHKLDFPVVTGKTVGVDDFYESQARLDGAFCNYSESDKFKYLQQMNSIGVRNIEMEAPCFASFCHRAGIKGAVVCVTFLNRLEGDQVTIPKEGLKDFESRPIRLVTAYIKSVIENNTH